MPFGLVHMDNGEIDLICIREQQPPGGRSVIEPIIAFSTAALPGPTSRSSPAFTGGP